MSDDGLIGWTIYGPTCTDLPGFFVVRSWIVGRGAVGWPYALVTVFPEGCVRHAFVGCCCRTLTEARDVIPPTLTNIGRQLSDDPVIVESWI